ncbi:hypothetical protein [Pseudonocardia sp. 73-21]|uniref:hypothetical protein n=1 Tax=Pseudonocardia sp. 73-21 TaxID=1895809 RepID=UPI00260F90A3|nr:hypothetical protein [Pseudonocardia sp. 73-21]
MAITKTAKTYTDTANTGQSTFAAASTALGNAVVVCTFTASATVKVTGITGTGFTWTEAGTGYSYGSGVPGGAGYLQIWVGKVTSVQSTAQTQTATFSASNSGIYCGFVPLGEWTTGAGAATTWTVDVTGQQTNAAATGVLYPTLTAAGAGELYIGNGTVGSGGSPSASGSGTGITFVVSTAAIQPYCYGVLASAGSTGTINQTDTTSQQTAAYSVLLIGGGDITVDDTAAASDTVAVTDVLATITDTATAADAVTTLDADLTPSADTATGTDAITSVTDLVTIADTATAADTVALGDTTAPIADTATASDTASAGDTAFLPATDTASASDAAAVIDVFPSTLLPLRPGPDYELLVIARVPAAAGPPTFLVVDPILWTSLDWTTELSKPQTLTLTCALSTVSEAVLQRLRGPAALATELWLLRDGQIVFAGPLTAGRRQGEQLTLNADGLLAYLARMVVYSDLVFSQVDQFAIVKALVEHWRARPYGDFGIDTSTVGTSGVLRDATYLKTELHKVLQRVQEMGQRLSGFDIDVDPASRRLQLWFPQRGVDRSAGEDAIVFDSRNITTASTMFSVAAEDVATVAFGTGTSTSDAGALYGSATNAELLAQYGASGVTATWDSVSEQPTLDGHVAGLLAARGDALFVPGPDVRVTPDADISAYDAGDLVRYELDDQLGIAGSFRLRSVRVQVSASGLETVSPSFV